jgi:hypothetical protein
MSRFRSDCSQCCGLCCVVPAFFSFQGFGADKPAHTPCSHLDSHGLCGIHRLRNEMGYTACAGYDCYGAGQWVTQVLFRGANWRDEPALAEAMFRAFTACPPLFELAAMLDAAIPLARLSSRPGLCAKRDELLELCASDSIRQRPADAGRLRREVQLLLQEFRTRDTA